MTLSAANIGEDLGPKNRPIWKLSSYGPAKYEPNLLTGSDVSQEEMRLRAYEALSLGKMDEYVSLNIFETDLSHTVSRHNKKWPWLNRTMQL